MTVATATMKWLMAVIISFIPGAQNGGIVGDENHPNGYHVSAQALHASGQSNDYSLQYPQDRQGQRNAASALDVTMGPKQMRLVTLRLLGACRDPRHPIRKYLRAFNGWTGSGQAFRYECKTGERTWADGTHMWHIHAEIFRKYTNDRQMAIVVSRTYAGLTPYPERPKPRTPRSRPRSVACTVQELQATETVKPVVRFK